MANYQVPKTPAFARELDSGIVQMHSHHYRNPSQLRPGGVLVVGVGNSGADIAMELIRTHPTWISGKESGYIPFPIDAAITRHFLVRLVRFAGHRVLTLSTPIGRRIYPKLLHQASPLIRVKPHYLTGAGVQRVPRVVGVRDGKPLLADQRTLDVQNVIWSTGYEPGFSWIKLPVFDDRGDPIHERGIVKRSPGLYFVGLHFLCAMTSATLTGVGRDAERIAKAITSRQKMALAKAA
jgi:putative flavoprotein involved in K+ transport